MFFKNIFNTGWEFASKPSERPTRTANAVMLKSTFLSTVKSAIIQKFLIMEPPEK